MERVIKEEPANPGSSGRMAVKPACVTVCVVCVAEGIGKDESRD